jgi:hypothetical protein
MPKLKRAAIRALAAEIVQKHGEVVGVRRQVEALINSLGDTLSAREIFEELQAIDHNGALDRRIRFRQQGGTRYVGAQSVGSGDK